MDSTNSYNLKQGEDEYILSITLLGEMMIKLSCEDKVKSLTYSKEFNVEDMKEIDQLFNEVQTAYDIIELFDDILTNDKVRIQEDNGVIQIILYITSEDRQINIILNPESDLNPELNIQKEEQQIQENYEQNEMIQSQADYTQNAQIQENYAQNEEYEETKEETGFNYNEEYNNIVAQNVNNNYMENIDTNMNEFTNINDKFNLNENANINIESTINNTENIIPQMTNVEDASINKYFENIQTNQSYNLPIITPVEEDKIQLQKQVHTQTQTEIKKYPQVNVQTQTQSQTEAQTQTIEQKDNYTQYYNQQKDVNTQYENMNYNVNINEYLTTNYNKKEENIIPSITTQVTKIESQETIIPQISQTKSTHNVSISLPKKNIRNVSLSLPKAKNEDEERIKKLKGEQNILKNAHSQFNNRITELTNLINTYKTKITVLESQKKTNELDLLREENQRIKQQLEELIRLKKDADEAKYIRNQLSELEPLRKKAAQVEVIKTQLLELNDLKMKVAELNTIKEQMNEIERLKLEINRLNNMPNNLEEINNLKLQIMQAENMRKQLEEMKLKSQKEEIITKKQTTTKSIIKGDIIHNLQELEMITRKINRSNSKIILNLLYKATADSDSASSFHQKCDKAESTLVLIETDKGKRFGGFTTQNWSGDGIEKKDENAFVFSLDKMKTYDNIEDEDAIGCYTNFGPVFLGCQIRIYDNSFKTGGTTFEKGLNYYTEEDYELTNGDRNFGVKEIEVYEVIVE